MRKTIILLLISCLAFSITGNAASSPTASAADNSSISAANITWTNEGTGYRVILEDDADLLSDSEESMLLSQMQEITKYGNAGFKTLSDNEFSTSYYTKEYYYELFGQQSGTLFVIDMDNREIYLFSDGTVYQTVTSAYADTITDNVYRYASRGDYYSCASHAFSQVHSLLSGNKIAQPMKYISNALLALILAALINYFVVRLLSGTAKPSQAELLGSASTGYQFTNPTVFRTHQSKTYSPQSSGSGGGGGGHRSGGGGGHRSGGGGGHRF